MKVVIAIDSLKGSLSSMEAGMAIKDGILAAKPDAEVRDKHKKLCQNCENIGHDLCTKRKSSQSFGKTLVKIDRLCDNICMRWLGLF